MNEPNPGIRIEPLRWPADAELALPGSKSEANRLLVAAALAGRPVTVTGATPCDDVRHLVRGLATLGYAARFVDAARGIVEVGPRAPASAPGRGELHCGNAGTALRFLVSVAAITPGEWTLTGDAAMCRRPIGPLVAAWRQLGVAIEDTDGCPPVRVHGRSIAGGTVQLDASVSSQFASSLLLVGPALPNGLTVRWGSALASADYVTLTTRALARLGVGVELQWDAARVAPGYGDVPATLAVAGDWSAMGVWTCLGHLNGSRIVATNLIAHSGQADERLGARLPQLAGDGDRTVDVAALPDQFPDLAIVAAFRRGTTTFTGGANLRTKESDRIAVMARGLDQLGVGVEERPDGLVVHGGGPRRAAVIDPAQDHRIAFAFALAGLLAPGITIRDPDCVAKSYPGFWQDLATVQRQPRCVVVVGMRGAGKSTFAAALAAAAGLPHVDTDRLFEQRFRPIAEFVAKYGWHNFRDLEADLVAEAVQPGQIVSTGGGAIEHPATQALLADGAFVLWLDADADALRARIAADPRERPSVTGAPVADEIETLLARRRPLFARCATFRLDALAPTAASVAEALRRLHDSGR
ncbi:MAG: 3-phosphoshikimate 1-carboxyvinyltransferase [Planctomycetes bacterium]|nr:3-phosphoshikimate 1-carboxyvinyltransferase [Planctomycetota bacterium]